MICPNTSRDATAARFARWHGECTQTSHEQGRARHEIRIVRATILVFCFFEVLPHYRVGVSEVHLIFGALLFLVFGAGPMEPLVTLVALAIAKKRTTMRRARSSITG